MRKACNPGSSITVLLELRCQAAHREITDSGECQKSTRPRAGRLLEPLPIRVFLPCVLPAGPPRWAKPRDSWGFEPAPAPPPRTAKTSAGRLGAPCYPCAVKVSEILRLLQQDGWVLVATRGSHRQYKHVSKPGRVTLPGKPSDDLAPGTQNSILKQAGLK